MRTCSAARQNANSPSLARNTLAGEFDRQPTDLELCAWIRFCYGREFYAEGADLFPHVVESRVEGEEYRAVKRMAAVCRLRAGNLSMKDTKGTK